jgi:hypothetical protein
VDAFSSRSTCWSGGKTCWWTRLLACARGGRHDAAKPPVRHRRIRRLAKALPKRERLSAIRKARGKRGIWQRRFREHLIRDAADYARHVEYCYVNPLKHRLVTRV